LAILSATGWKFFLVEFWPFQIEVATLEDVKLVDIEFKRHEPYQIVEKHLAQCNVKIYMHEYSPYDDMFMESNLMRRYKAEFRHYPLTNKPVSSLSKRTDEVFFPRYYRDN
jgi:hypothetical protein